MFGSIYRMHPKPGKEMTSRTISGVGSGSEAPQPAARSPVTSSGRSPLPANSLASPCSIRKRTTGRTPRIRPRTSGIETYGKCSSPIRSGMTATSS